MENVQDAQEAKRLRNNAANRERIKALRRAGHPSYLASRETILLGAARHRAKKAGIPCTLTIADIVIPKRCPILGIELKHRIGKRGQWDYSPTVDRRDITKGYTPDNVCIISARANRIKSDATPAELRAVADYAAGTKKRRRRVDTASKDR